MSLKLNRICVFAGSNPGRNPEYEKGAAELGRALASRGIGLVYGGSRIGLMGTVADAVLKEGGEVIGVMPRGLFAGEMKHQGLTQFIETADMHERKAKMNELADGFIALPGGFGTFEELFEVISWLQLGIHHKPVGLMDINGYYQPVMDLLHHAVDAGFARREHVEWIVMEKDPLSLLERLMQFERPKGIHKWREEGIGCESAE